MHDLADLIVLLVRLSFVAFGGGIAILPELQRVVVSDHHWLTSQQFASSYAMGQLTPGPGMLMVLAIGYKVAGVPGALAAMVAMFLPVGTLAYIAGSRLDKLKQFALAPCNPTWYGAGYRRSAFGRQLHADSSVRRRRHFRLDRGRGCVDAVEPANKPDRDRTGRRRCRLALVSVKTG